MVPWNLPYSFKNWSLAKAVDDGLSSTKQLEGFCLASRFVFESNNKLSRLVFILMQVQ